MRYTLGMMSAYLRLFTPTNLAEERDRFFSSTSYQPQLQYDWSGASIAAALAENPTIKQFAEALQAQNLLAIHKTALDFFQVELRSEDIALAKQIVATPPQPTHATADQVVHALEQALAELKIRYTVILSDQAGFLCRPNHSEHTITISRHGHFQNIDPWATAKHELIHVIRAVNGQANDITPEVDYLATEEGLASLIQDYYTTTGESSLFQHALEYYGSYLSETEGLRAVYLKLKEFGLSDDMAWQRGIRQKYGLCDTSQPGGILKSAMYFYHEQLLRELKPEELLPLFVGKISQASLKKYPVYMGMIPEKVLRKFLEL